MAVSQVRFVLHSSMPSSKSALSQESGRAGRDGAPAECILLSSTSDLYRNEALVVKGSILKGTPLTRFQKQSLSDALRMALYCQDHTTCRHASLLQDFDEVAPTPCNMCDVCETKASIQTFDASVLAQSLRSLVTWLHGQEVSISACYGYLCLFCQI